MRKKNKLLFDEKGSTASEYALVASLISIVIVGGLIIIGSYLHQPFDTVGNTLGR